jgi:seryl-tRNA(Sec) selenium transferase
LWQRCAADRRDRLLARLTRDSLTIADVAEVGNDHGVPVVVDAAGRLTPERLRATSPKRRT